jgi:hypothetical protein
MAPTKTALNLALDAFLGFRLGEWNGLPPCLTAEIAASLGPPAEAANARLGANPALREVYAVPGLPAGGLVVFSRAHRVMAIESAFSPPNEVLAMLGEPDVRKPPELSLPGYFVHEYLYCRRGLVLAVAESLPPAEPQVKIARCRGVQTLAAPYEYGADYYLALQNRILYTSES